MHKLANSAATDSLIEPESLVRNLCRQLYDMRNMFASHQVMSLYACEIGGSAYDAGHGGIYTNHLIDATNRFNGTFLLASKAHEMAIGPTSCEAASHGVEQTPDCFMPKLLSGAQIVLAINEENYHTLGIWLKVLQSLRLTRAPH